MKVNRHNKVNEEISIRDYNTLYKQLLLLSWKQQLVIQLRFWENYSIYQVARELGISWKEADALIDSALLKLRQGLEQSLGQSVVLTTA